MLIQGRGKPSCSTSGDEQNEAWKNLLARHMKWDYEGGILRVRDAIGTWHRVFEIQEFRGVLIRFFGPC